MFVVYYAGALFRKVNTQKYFMTFLRFPYSFLYRKMSMQRNCHIKPTVLTAGPFYKHHGMVLTAENMINMFINDVIINAHNK